MLNQPKIVQVKLDNSQRQPRPMAKALQIKRNEHKTIIVYNYINGYILTTLMEAVFIDAH